MENENLPQCHAPPPLEKVSLQRLHTALVEVRHKTFWYISLLLSPCQSSLCNTRKKTQQVVMDLEYCKLTPGLDSKKCFGINSVKMFALYTQF